MTAPEPEGGFLASFLAQTPRIPGYRIEGVLGAGGHSTVYAAAGEGGRRVALKHFHPAWAPQRERLAREIEVHAKLAHPHLATFLGVVEDGEGTPCVLMEPIEGPSLAEVIAAEGPLTSARLAAVALPLVDLLGHLRAHGVVHRDIKPANVVLRAPDDPVLVDFSVAYLTPSDPVEERLTATGQAIGTRPYMAPEQCGGETGAIDGRTDLYGLGALLFHAATGAPPWEQESGWERTQRNPWRDPYPTRTDRRTAVEAARERLPAAWGVVIASCLEGDPGRRWPAGLDALTRVLEALARGDGEGASRLAEQATPSSDAGYETDDQPVAPAPIHERQEALMNRSPLALVVALSATITLAAGAFALLDPGADASPDAPVEAAVGPLPTAGPRPRLQTPAPGAAPTPANPPIAHPPSATPRPRPPAPRPSHAAALDPARLSRLLADFDAAFRTQDGLGAATALRGVMALGREAYPEAVRCLIRFRYAKGDWGRMVVLSNAKSLLPVPFLHWALRTRDLGLSQPKEDRAIRELCLMYLRGEPAAVVTSLEAHVASRRFEPSSDLRLVLRRLDRLDDPATAALLERLLSEPRVDVEGKQQVLGMLAKKTNPAAARALQAASRDADPQVAERAKLLLAKARVTIRGAFVLAVKPGSHAERSGIRPGDVITAFAGQPIDDAYALQKANMRHDGEVKVEVARGAQRLTLRYDSSSYLELESAFVAPR